MPNEGAPPEPRPAATIVVARDAAQGEGIEIFLVQRHGKIGFMGGMHVFPGGKVAPEDRDARLRARVSDHTRIEEHDVWGEGFARDDAFALALAAIRETFEEAGLLLTRDAPDARALADARERLHGGTPFVDLLEELDVQLSLGLLSPFSRWITPESEPVRFDTAFYVARAPAGQIAEHDRRETVSGRWLSPAGALQAVEAGELRLAPPTAQTLGSLRDVGSVDAALALAASRPPPVILPLLRQIDDELVILYPGDPEHPMKERALPGPTRRVFRKL